MEQPAPIDVTETLQRNNELDECYSMLMNVIFAECHTWRAFNDNVLLDACKRTPNNLM